MCETVRICVKARLIDAYEQYLAPAVALMSERVCPWMRWKTRDRWSLLCRGGRFWCLVLRLRCALSFARILEWSQILKKSEHC